MPVRSATPARAAQPAIVYAAATIAALGAVLFGYDTA
jgi:hypothetical protein